MGVSEKNLSFRVDYPHTTIQTITILNGTTHHRHHLMLNIHHPHRLQGRQSILQDLHSHCQSTTKLLTSTTTTAARVSPNILPLYLLCVSSTTILVYSTTTILLHSTVLQPPYYTLHYYTIQSTTWTTQDKQGKVTHSYTRTTLQLHQDYTTAIPGLYYT